MSQPSPLDGRSDSQAPPPTPHTTPAGPLARLSLEQKLPLILAGLALAVMAGLSAVSIYEVRTTTLEMGRERLTALNQQFATLFSMSGPQQRTQSAALASRPGIMEFARTGSRRARDLALAELRAPTANPEQVLVNELRDGRGRLLLSSQAGSGVDTLAMADIFPPRVDGDSAAIGAFRKLRDTLVFPVAMAVKGSTNVYAVRWRRVNVTERTRDAVERMLGTYATPYLGNPGGEHWVNFRTIVPRPPLDLASTEPTQMYERDGQTYLAAKTALPGAPWMVALEVPMTTILAPANTFQRRFFMLGLVALGLALFAARILSKRITKPLVQLAEAATRIADGDFSHPVRINRHDELGKLGDAFASMATEVQSTRDNLERKVAERTQQLHDAQEALVRRERLALLGQLSSGVGHELRNPLSVMTNSVYLLRLHLESQPKNVHDYLDILQQQIALSEKIVSDLLDFTRSRPPQRRPTSLTEVSQQQVARLGQMEGVNIESTLNGSLPAVLVDSSQAGQIILNLLANAVQAIDGPGLIRIRGLADGGHVHMDVMDSGPGVPTDIIDKIFEPLFTTKARGLGLGLAVSRTLARANGGDLTASNSPNGGAVFRLSLPIATAEMH